MKIKVNVNGENRVDEVEPRTLLVEFLRENLKLTGTHVGCDTTQCGACTVHMNGEAIKSCTIFAIQADNKNVTTIEGISSNGEMHPMQASFKENHGLQCGFCTPGMVMAGIDIRRRKPDINEDDLRIELEGNICRCTGYHNIVKSILNAKM